MTHFLKPDEVRGAYDHLTRPRAVVTVRYEAPNLLRVQPDMPIGVVKPDVGMVPVPDRIKVVDPKGKAIRPSGKFLVSTESFNPYHLVADWKDS